MSKLKDANKKIEETVVGGYKKIEDTVVSGYKKVDLGIVITFIIGIVGSLIMGFGMSKIMVGEVGHSDMIVGLVTGIVGLIICVLNYPIYAYIKSNKE